MSGAIRLLTIAAALLLAACRSTPDRQPDLPPPCPLTPVAQVVERRVYVPLPAEDTAPEPVAEGPLRECPRVAAERKAALERANAKLRKAAAKQGTEVKP